MIKILSRYLPLFLPAILGISLTACVAARPDDKPADISYLVKTDIDTVADIHIRETFRQLRELTRKLYLRNPRELYKNGNTSPARQVARIFDNTHNWQFPELGKVTGVKSIILTFDENFSGDRVLAFAVGLSTMINASYNNKKEFFVFDDLSPQKLYNCARNIEIAVWRLSNSRNSKGDLFLLSNGRKEEARNLSFERLFGKLISQQDTMARIMEQKNQRAIKTIIQSLASAVFLPI